MRTGAEYLAALDDGRQTYFEGRLVPRITDDPVLCTLAQSVARGHDEFYLPGPDAVNPMMRAPRSVDELRERAADAELLEQTILSTYLSFMTLISAGPKLPPEDGVYRERIDRYVDTATRDDIRIAQCITDAKGDRSVGPLGQADPDVYVRVVDRGNGGVVIRGAKMHISGASLSDHLFVMPTKAMKPGEEAYAIACAVPLNTPGVKVVNTTAYPRGEDPRSFPISSRESLLEGFVVFDEVFVPDELIFLDGQVDRAAVFVHSLGPWVRLNGVARYVRQAHILVGLAQLIAEANGTLRVPHIREKIDEMLIHATMLQAGMEASITAGGRTADGYCYPDELYTNAAKYHGAAQFNHMVRHLHDIAGGAVVTAPSIADLENDDVGPLLHKYLQAGSAHSGETRLRLMHTIRDFTADAFGGWNTVMNLVSGGSLFAQRSVARKYYDMNAAKQMALETAAIAEIAHE